MTRQEKIRAVVDAYKSSAKGLPKDKNINEWFFANIKIERHAGLFLAYDVGIRKYRELTNWQLNLMLKDKKLLTLILRTKARKYKIRAIKINMKDCKEELMYSKMIAQMEKNQIELNYFVNKIRNYDNRTQTR